MMQAYVASSSVHVHAQSLRGERAWLCGTRVQGARGGAYARRGAVAALTMTATAPVSQQQYALRFLDAETALQVQQKVGTPCYVYDMKSLRAQAEAMLKFPNAFGLTVRYAMKAAPNVAVLQLFKKMGLHIDASSGYEIRRALNAGFEPHKIYMSTQELPADFKEFLDMGVGINACSLSQLERIGKACPGARVGLRFNPGRGSGGTGKTNVGGPDSSFGIWHELIPHVQQIVEKYGLNVEKIHTHIGSGSDPVVWQEVSNASLGIAAQFPSATILNLGGGYKVARTPTEKGTDIQQCGEPVKQAFEKFASDHGRQLKLEVEPGTFLVANCCSLVCTAQDVVSTGASGHEFIKLDAGMTEVLRPSLYGAVHPVVVVPRGRTESESQKYVVVGHCCESGDLITCAPGEPETLMAVSLPKTVIGDAVVVEGVGAYCAGMSTKNYNSFPEAAEVMLDLSGKIHVVRNRQPAEQIWQNEKALDDALLS
ncbi:Diaminopimelate decarboxylase [Porphyridium purpureum]|uniref:Diaminopimelate decarboxylase n=1 Tax=Porphyridium purpureum TaxID=35688 RepID=A0A5J4Z8F2_PORPP|nr:Diaminopimelate decarboxylase [Porphyridium purpureum]|eukprot:POR8136..scf295_1